MRITKKQGGIIGGAVAVVLIAAAIGVHAHYQNRWYPGSTFNKVDVSGMTYEGCLQKAAQPKCIFNDLWWQKNQSDSSCIIRAEIKGQIKTIRFDQRQ